MRTVQTLAPGDDFETSDGLSAKALLRSIRRHRTLVVTVVLLFCGIGALIGLGLPPRYTATGALVLRLQPQPIVETRQAVPANLLIDPAAIRSQMDVLRSRGLIEQVVRKLALWRFREFQTTDLPHGWTRQAVVAHLRDLSARLAGSGPNLVAVHATARHDQNRPPTPAEIDTAIGSYAAHLRIENDAQSMTLSVAFTAQTPARAAEIVNEHMEAYRSLYQQDQAADSRSANAWLNGQIDKLRPRLEGAEAAIARYRVQHQLTGTAEDRTALSAQLAALTTQLVSARAQLAENEARAAEIRAHAGSAAGATGPEVTNSNTIGALRAQEGMLIEREASLSAEFGSAYPPLQRVRSSLQHLRAQISAEAGRDYAAALELVDRSRIREQSIERSVGALTSEVNSSDSGLRQLQQNAEAIRSLLHRFQQHAEETAAEPAFIASNSTIITRADLGDVTKASIMPMLAGGGFAGMILGVLLALVRDLRDGTFRTSTQIAQYLEPTAVGATPRVAHSRRQSPADLILREHRSIFAEAFRVSWANIRLFLAGPGAALDKRRSGTVLGITSAIAGEGKSMHALGFARTVALAGESVVLVDADLRRSGVSRLLERRPEATLGDFLRGGCTIDEVITETPPSSLHFIPSAPAETAWTLPDMRRFRDLIVDLRRRFAVVIIDLPPVLGLSETLQLATLTDGVALIIRWARTDRELVRMACAALRGVGVTAIATILNDVDLRAQRRREGHDGYSQYYVWSRSGPKRSEAIAPRPPLSPLQAQPSNAGERDAGIGTMMKYYTMLQAQRDNSGAGDSAARDSRDASEPYGGKAVD